MGRSTFHRGVVRGVEALEGRKLLSTAVLGTGGVLTITGGAERNGFYVSFGPGGKMNVTDGGQLIGSFDKAAPKKLIINCGEGNDQVHLGGIGVPARIDGGAGDDHLYASDMGDTIIGGDGNDYVTALDGNDSI